MSTIHVGKYTSPMDDVAMETWPSTIPSDRVFPPAPSTKETIESIDFRAEVWEKTKTPEEDLGSSR